jgi:hypothetical protein
MANAANIAAVMASAQWLDDDNFAGGGATIRDLVIDGNKTNNTTGYGIILQNWSTRVQDCEVRMCKQDGIRYTDTSSGAVAITNTAVGNRIERNRSIQNDGVGIRVAEESATGALTDGMCVDNYVAEPGEEGINIQRAAGWHVTGNRTFSTGYSGIFVDRCQNTLVSGNVIQDFGSTTTVADYYRGILMLNCLDKEVNIVSNNIISNVNAVVGNTYQGVAVVPAAGLTAYVMITGNFVTGSGAGVGFRISVGTGTDVEGVFSNNSAKLLTAGQLASIDGGLSLKQFANEWNHDVVTFNVNDATPKVDEGTVFLGNYSSATNVTDFDNWYSGQVIHVRFTNANATLVHGASLNLAAAVNWTPAGGDMITLVCYSGVWYELSRSVNN